MKRLVYLISTFLILAGMYGGSVGAGEVFWISAQHYSVPAEKFSASENEMSAMSKRLYVEWVQGGPVTGYSIALALSPNGWAAGYGADDIQAQRAALRYCRTQIRSNSCKIVDVNGTSAFIKQRGSSGSTATASSSSSTTSSSGSIPIWCATKYSVSRINWDSRNSCTQNKGKFFWTYSSAVAEKKRLKRSSSSSSSTAQGSVFCYRASSVATPRYFYKPTTRRCESGDFEITEQEFDDRKAPLYVASSSVSTASSSSKVWCANASKTWLVDDESSCRAKSGKSFSTRYEANAHSRIQAKYGASSTASSSSSIASTTTQAAQTATAQTASGCKAIGSDYERDLWNSVKDSDDPEEYRIYLDECPTGTFARLAKSRIKKFSSGGTTALVAQSSIPNLDYGDYYALVIGNNDYELLPDLKTAVNDATKVASVLEYDYGFKVELLTDATRSDILKSLFGYRKVVGESDNLLIYYAGHGELDEGAKKGYWLPVDAARDDPSNWIMTDQVVAQITAMEAKHVMVVADSCFSGELTRGIKIDYGSPNWIQKLVKKKARIALTSGGLEPVSDSGGGSHSVFAKVFISLLEENTGVLNTQKLFTELRPRVMKNTRQTPEHGTIHLAGDDGGDFLFVRKAPSSVDSVVVGSAIQTKVTSGQTLNSTTVSSAVSVSEEEAYDAAFNLLKQAHYADAAVVFAQFIRRFPNSELTDDAWYWMGEARFVTREFSQSLGAFQNVINNFMDSPRIPASYLKVGYIQYEYGAYIKARETLNFVLGSFPNHRVVVNAKARLEKMDREGY